PGTGLLSAASLLDLLREHVIGSVACFEDPERALAGLPDRWWRDVHGLVEWAVSRDARGTARTMIERHLTAYPNNVAPFAEGLATADQAIRISPLRTEVSLGRAAVALGLYRADEQLAVTEPGGRRTFWQRLRGEG